MHNETLAVVAMRVCNCEMHFRRAHNKLKLQRIGSDSKK